MDKMVIAEESSKSLPLPIPRSRDGAVVPFNRLETRNWELCAALAWVRHPDPLTQLRQAFQELTGRQHIIFSPSGHCAIAQILSVLPQREVVMPAWLCIEVKKAAELVGKRIIYVDLAKNNINATSAEFAEAAQPGRILLVPHLYGVPTDIEAICELARSRDCVTIEDAVPAVGGRRNGRLLGTFADFGVFSFEKSKRLPAFRGGVIVVNNDSLVDPGKLAASRVVETKQAMPARELIEALLHNLITTPWIYRWFTLPLLPLRDLGPELLRKGRRKPVPPQAKKQAAGSAAARDPSYAREVHPYQAELVLRLLRRMDEMRRQIAHLAAIYAETFRNTAIATFAPPGCDYGGLMRFPIVFPGKDRAEVVRLARKRGIYLKVIWKRILPEPSEYARFPNAVWAAQNMVLLPLYPALSPKSAERLAQNVIEIERDAPAI
ncbi:MAG TPA: DegT/DnrJ/EryC1/StrS family aminotransferase [Terriglobia bacterium]|nr:DegT/DnrJ/EryC1/StrS family aminotransferase [Terriglobia bacterium]